MRRFCVWLLTLCLLLLLGISVSAGDILAYADEGFTGAEKSVFYPTGNDPETVVADLPLYDWNFAGNIAYQRRRVMDGIPSINAYLTEPEEAIFYGGEASTELAIPYDMEFLDLTGYKAFFFGITVTGPGTHYPLSITLETTEETVTAEVYVSGSNSRARIALDISDVDGILRTLKVRVSYDLSTLPEIIVCTSPYFTQTAARGFTVAEKYAASQLSADVGKVTLSSGKVMPENGYASLHGKLVTQNQPVSGAGAYFEIRLSGVTQGNMTLGILYAGTTEEQQYYSQKISLTAPDGIYVIPLEVYDDIHSFTLQFDNVECDVFFTVDSIRLYSGVSASLVGNSDVGSVTSITRSGNSITFRGSMERDSVTRFSGKTIDFYALPCASADDIDSAILLGSIKVTTVFEYTIDLSAYQALGDTFLFFAAVENTLAETDTERAAWTKLLLSHPRYADAGVLREANVSNVGLYASPTVGAFESNVSHVMVDVPLDELLTSGGSTSVSYLHLLDGEFTSSQIYFNHDLLKSLDRDIEFYISAGIEVYLRITSSSPIKGLTYDGNSSNYAVNLFYADAQSLYAAVIRYLSARYSGIAGYSLGIGVNAEEFVGEDAFDEPATYASLLAEMCRITYNAASYSIPDVLVIVPFVRTESVQTESIQTEQAGAAEENVLSEKTLSVMLADRLDALGQMPWGFLYTFEEAGAALEDVTASITAMNRLTADLELQGADTVMFFYQPTIRTLSSEYEAYTAALTENIPEFNTYTATAFAELCDTLAAYRARAVFLSLDGISVQNDHEFYAQLKRAGQSDRFVYDALAENREITGSTYTLWDFSNSYYTLDWIAGGGVDSCLTASSPLFRTSSDDYTRALRASFTSEEDAAAGIILRNLSREYDFTGIDSLEFTFALESAADDSTSLSVSDGATVVFVIGTDDYRAEYYADALPCGEILRLSCDLTGYEYRSRVDYIGIMVYADHTVHLDLSAVRLGSTVLTADALAEMFTVRDTAAAEGPNLVSVTGFLLLIAVITVAMAILLTRRDHEDDEIRAAEAAALNHRHMRRRQ